MAGKETAKDGRRQVEGGDGKILRVAGCWWWPAGGL